MSYMSPRWLDPGEVSRVLWAPLRRGHRWWRRRKTWAIPVEPRGLHTVIDADGHRWERLPGEVTDAAWVRRDVPLFQGVDWGRLVADHGPLWRY